MLSHYGLGWKRLDEKVRPLAIEAKMPHGGCLCCKNEVSKLDYKTCSNCDSTQDCESKRQHQKLGHAISELSIWQQNKMKDRDKFQTLLTSINCNKLVTLVGLSDLDGSAGKEQAIELFIEEVDVFCKELDDAERSSIWKIKYQCKTF